MNPLVKLGLIHFEGNNMLTLIRINSLFYYSSKYVKNIKTVLKVSPQNISRIRRWLHHPQSFFSILNSQPQSSGGLNHFIFDSLKDKTWSLFYHRSSRVLILVLFIFWPTSPIWIWGEPWPSKIKSPSRLEFRPWGGRTFFEEAEEFSQNPVRWKRFRTFEI